MHDSSEKFIRDFRWQLNAAYREGLAERLAQEKLKGEMEGRISSEIKIIQFLQKNLKLPVSSKSDFAGKSLEELLQQTAELHNQTRNRRSS